jgi:hypothetical protein
MRITSFTAQPKQCKYGIHLYLMQWRAFKSWRVDSGTHNWADWN